MYNTISGRLFWAAVFTVAAANAMLLVLGSWERYNENPTVVSLEKDYREWNTLFPAITMCYLDSVNQTRAEEEIHK